MPIDLEKNPSGTWEPPGRRRFAAFLSGLTRLRRLWIVVAVIYLALEAVTGYVLMPTRVQVERAMVFAVTEEVREK
jgi:hypothetical protein